MLAVRKGHPNGKTTGRNRKRDILTNLELVRTMRLPRNFHADHDVRPDGEHHRCLSCFERIYDYKG